MATSSTLVNGGLISVPAPPSWVVDLHSAPSTIKTKTISIPDPPGFVATSNSSKRGDNSKQGQAVTRQPPTAEEMDTLKLKKAWEVAFAPAKQLPMSAIGMWMTGNSLQIFSIFMVFTLFKSPIQALMSVNTNFARFESDSTKSKMILVKLLFILTNLLALGLGIYKVDKMGLLPTTRSDWLAWESPREALEQAFPALSG